MQIQILLFIIIIIIFDDHNICTPFSLSLSFPLFFFNHLFILLGSVRSPRQTMHVPQEQPQFHPDNNAQSKQLFVFRSCLVDLSAVHTRHGFFVFFLKKQYIYAGFVCFPKMQSSPGFFFTMSSGLALDPSTVHLLKKKTKRKITYQHTHTHNSDRTKKY